MKFEEQFPSLLNLEIIKQDKNGEFRCPDWIDMHKFPERVDIALFSKDEIQKHCLDKTKVREAIFKICVLEIGEGQGKLDYRGIKLIQELRL